ncbi:MULTISPECIES: hypothetical protein [Cryobacterium]|uniref:Uncharacterized protein n=1 Tax=Cryobacterium breve TaxID=1259258 RepID=A0ABY2J1D2_9MICO|nr:MULTISPECIES: hypothetical protein [Cryobacterium]TFC96694.1 hypothetical protein E3T20_01425 [Cryobacterium sp. TmT3-12]TFC97509.1 hypothetical protein E3O65_12075 [Cryobacterium breve]
MPWPSRRKPTGTGLAITASIVEISAFATGAEVYRAPDEDIRFFAVSFATPEDICDAMIDAAITSWTWKQPYAGGSDVSSRRVHSVVAPQPTLLGEESRDKVDVVANTRGSHDRSVRHGRGASGEDENCLRCLPAGSLRLHKLTHS